MSLDLYSGIPGSGKSLHSTARVLTSLARGRDVVSNYPIKFTAKEIKKGFEDRFYYVPNERLTVNNLMNFAHARGYLANKKENQCLVLIDEAGGQFNCREFGKSDRREWIDMFSQHRKLGFNFIIVAQHDRMIDRQIRNMVEMEYKHKKVQNLYWWLGLLPIKLFVAVEHFYGQRFRTGAEWFRYKKSLGDRYDSMRLFDGYKLPEFQEITSADVRAIFSM